ncbi:Sodium/calcium exchanger protein-domain-containing protein [Zopfochytrium polystomum]|nr:Sodium/calcium exchanger protein-domain-containing protein [Zopfochytrium polystomum]
MTTGARPVRRLGRRSGSFFAAAVAVIVAISSLALLPLAQHAAMVAATAPSPDSSQTVGTRLSLPHHAIAATNLTTTGSPVKLDDDDNDDDQDIERSVCVDKVWRQKDPCAFIKSTACSGVGVGSIANYAENYVCAPLVSRLIQFPLLLFFLLNLFATAGIVASEFFGPSFKGLLRKAGFSIATITAFFLALGNGSLEIFAAIGAVRTGQTDLAFGELVSSAFFTATLGVGVIAYFQPFKFVRRAFLRDVVFLIISMMFTVVILWDDDIKLFEAGGFLGLYIGYLLLVTVGAAFFGRDHRDEGATSDVPAEDDERFPPLFRDGATDGRGFGVYDGANPPVGANRANAVIKSFVETFVPPVESQRDGALQGESSSSRAAASASRYGSTDGPAATRAISNELSRGEIRSVWSSFAVNEAAERGAASRFGQSSASRVDPREATAQEWLFPTLPMSGDGDGWSRRSSWEKFVSLAIAPSVFFVRLAIPVVYEPGQDSKALSSVPSGLASSSYDRLPGDDFEDGYGGGSNAQASNASVLFDAENGGSRTFDSPAAAAAALSVAQPAQRGYAAAPPPVLPPRNLFLIQNFVAGLLFFITYLMCVLGGAGALYLSVFIQDRGSRIGFYYKIISLVTAVSLGYLIAVEMVALLATLGMSLGVSAAFIGLTIFAFGCNLGDVMTNVSLARHGLSSIAVRASFAAPTLNLLVGFGISTVWVLVFSGRTKKVKPPPPEKPTDPADPPSNVSGLISWILTNPSILESGPEIVIETKTSVLILCYALLAAAAFSLYYVPTNGFQATKKYGLLLGAWWAASMLVSILVELIAG